MLTRQEIKRSQTKTLDVPEWGGQVLIRKLSANDALYVHEHFGGEPLKGQRAIDCSLYIVREGVVDEDCNPIFADTKDVAGALSFELLMKLADEILGHSGLRGTVEDAAKKNLVRSNGSPIDSASPSAALIPAG